MVVSEVAEVYWIFIAEYNCLRVWYFFLIYYICKWMGKASDRFHSHIGIILHLKTVNQINIISFCLGKRDTGSGPLYPWLWVLVKYHLFLIIMSGYFIKSKYKLISSLIRRKFQRFRNFSFENISLCLGKHIGRSLSEFATYSFTRMSKIITFRTCKLWADVACASNIESP